LPDSQYNLNILAEHGLGMAKNLGAAYQCFALAAKTGDTETAVATKSRLSSISPAAEQAVKRWKAKAANPEAHKVASRRVDRVG
jgi:localization factor PodJL